MRALRGTTTSGLVAAVVSLLVAWGVSARGAEPFTEKLAQGERIPRPPMQNAAWTPPATQLPEALLTATKTLFELGLADPRKCEYRKIALARGVDANLRGWLIPSDGTTARRFAVCWNGLVYPVAQIGARADLQADLRAAMKRDKELIAEDKDGMLDFSRGSPDIWADEGAGISHETVVPLKVCLLLRLGEVELAGDVWSAWKDRLRPGGNCDEFVEKPFLIMAENWSLYAFCRALSAHIDGDDRLAWIAIREYGAIEEGLRAQAVILGVQRYRPLTAAEQLEREFGAKIPGITPGGQVPVYLDPDPDYRGLLADQERRARESAAPRPLVATGDQAGRIAALIRDLEDINTSWTTPGDSDFSRDPTYQKLVAEGEQAVRPLFDVVENDDRLTRTSMSGRGMRWIVPVHDAAFAALRAILGTDEFGMDLGNDHGERHRAVARMRAYWEQNQKIPIELRWYRRMDDDATSFDQWLDAASRIVAPAGSTAQAGVIVSPRLCGESLRNKKDTNVSALMARRVVSMSSPRGARGTADLHKAVRMACYLARWDRAAAVPVLRVLSASCLAPGGQFHRTEPALRAYPELVALRAHCGDLIALDEYAAWLLAQPVSTLESSGTILFEPLCRFADHPSMLGLAARLFSDPKSPWSPLVLSDPNTFKQLVTSPLLGVPAFRSEIMKCLSNKSILGEVTPGPRVKNIDLGPFEIFRDSMMAVRLARTEQSERYPAEDPLAKPGARSTFRVCDYFAWRLSPSTCQLYWPEQKRDEAVAAYRSFLGRYGAYFKTIDLNDRPEGGPFDLFSVLCLPALDRPATPDDVARGLAIFSLGPGADVRVVPLRNRPLIARWRVPGAPANAEERVEGMVWQAEEIRENGKLQRFYGVISFDNNLVARIPAEELEVFPDADPFINRTYP